VERSGAQGVVSVKGESSRGTGWYVSLPPENHARTLAWRAAIVVICLAAWEFASGRLIKPFWISSPSEIWRQLSVWVATGQLWLHVEVTLSETLMGFAFGAISGVAVGLALGLKTWSDDIVACTHGAPLERRQRERLARNGIQTRLEPIARIEHDDGALSRIAFASGEALPRDALFFATGQHPQSSLAITLGCTLNRRGTVKTGSLCDTNVPRLYVAGDASRDAQFVVVAAAEGVKAALAINKALQAEELR